MARLILNASASLLLVAAPAAAQDARGTRDIVFERQPGARLYRQAVKDLDQVRYAIPGPSGDNIGPLLEGERAWTVYQGPQGSSGFAAFRHYQRQFALAGFTTRYSCSRERCPAWLFGEGMGGGLDEVVYAMRLAGNTNVADRHYLVAQRKLENGAVETARLAIEGPTLPIAAIDLMTVEPN